MRIAQIVKKKVGNKWWLLTAETAHNSELPTWTIIRNEVTRREFTERYVTALASEGEESMIALVKANEGDLEFLSQVCLDVSELYSPILPDAFERQSEKFQNNGLSKNYNIRIIFCNSERVGFLGDIYLKSGTYYLTALYFLKKFQRCGLGREVHEIIVNELVEAGVERLALFAHEEAYWAIDFYKNIGYEVIGDTRRDVEEYDSDLVNYYLPNTKLMSLNI